MPTKTIGVREEVYERLHARKRDDESFTDLIDRLIDESEGDWRDGFGSLSPEDATSLRETVVASRTRFNESADERQTAAIDRLADASAEHVADADNDRASSDLSNNADPDDASNADPDDTDPDDVNDETGGST